MKFARTYKDFQLGRFRSAPSRDPWSSSIYQDPAENEPWWTSGQDNDDRTEGDQP